MAKRKISEVASAASTKAAPSPPATLSSKDKKKPVVEMKSVAKKQKTTKEVKSLKPAIEFLDVEAFIASQSTDDIVAPASIAEKTTKEMQSQVKKAPKAPKVFREMEKSVNEADQAEILESDDDLDSDEEKEMMAYLDMMKEKGIVLDQTDTGRTFVNNVVRTAVLSFSFFDAVESI